MCKLKKAIYGLKQSPRAWYSRLQSALNSQHFKISSADHSLFIKHSNNGVTVVIIYVDDIIITGSDILEIKNTKIYLKSTFDIKDLGHLR